MVLERGTEFAGIILDPVAQGMIPPEHGIVHIGTPDTPRAILSESDRETVGDIDRDVVNLADSCDELEDGDVARVPETTDEVIEVSAEPVVAPLEMSAVPTAATVESSVVVLSDITVTEPVHSGLSDVMEGVELQESASVPIGGVTVSIENSNVVDFPRSNGNGPSWGSVMELASIDPPQGSVMADSPASPDPSSAPRMLLTPEPRPQRYQRFTSERVMTTRPRLSDGKVRFLLSKRREHERKIIKRSPDHPLRAMLTDLLMEIARQLGDHSYRVPEYDPEYADRMSITQEAASLRAQMSQLEQTSG